MAKGIYTIGYSGFPDVEDFISALKQHGIQILIDVRSSPFSAYYENYNKDMLAHTLQKNGIYYANYARQFGARQEDRSFYKNGRLDFETFSQSEQFLEGVQSVERSRAVIAFMCAEKHPTECHRAILVTRAFSERGHEIVHIKPGGVTLSQSDIEQELLEKYFPDRAQTSLFEETPKTEAEYIAEAYRLRNDEIGFKLEDLDS